MTKHSLLGAYVNSLGKSKSIALVQHLGGADVNLLGVTTVISLSKTVTAGNKIIVSWGCYGNATASICIDNLGNVYTLCQITTGACSAALFYAPVTVGGSITTITITHGSVQYKAAQASEWSGVGSFVGASGGSGTYSATVTFAANIAIPANGVVFGTASNPDNYATTAGPNSGSPSTSISVEHDTPGVNVAITTLYAVAGASTVTNFAGTGISNPSGNKVGAGGIFNSI